MCEKWFYLFEPFDNCHYTKKLFSTKIKSIWRFLVLLKNMFVKYCTYQKKTNLRNKKPLFCRFNYFSFYKSSNYKSVTKCIVSN